MAKANTEPKLYSLKLNQLRVTVVGLTSLLTNKWTQEAIDGLTPGHVKRPKEAKDPEEIYQEHIHRTEDGTPGIPASAFKKSMIRAAKRAGLVMKDTNGDFVVLGDVLPIRGSEPVLNIVPGRANGRTPIVICRPEFHEWEVDLDIVYDVNATTAEQIINLIEGAGFAVGVGAFRPESGGNHGRFQIKK
jgi:hypothetical protein